MQASNRHIFFKKTTYHLCAIHSNFTYSMSRMQSKTEKVSLKMTILRTKGSLDQNSMKVQKKLCETYTFKI